MELKKNPEVSIEKKKLSLVFIGLIVASSVMLSAFEGKTFEQEALVASYKVVDDEEEEEIEEYVQPPEQTPPPPPPPAPPEEIELIEDDSEEEETEEIIELPDEDEDVGVIDDPVREVIDDNIFDIVEQQPEFPGGLASLRKYLGKNIEYPKLAADAGIQGKVYVGFVVERDGSVSGVKVRRGIGGGCDEEAMRVVKSMPKWKPGKQRNKAVRVRYNLPIVFKLQ